MKKIMMMIDATAEVSFCVFNLESFFEGELWFGFIKSYGT